jgi:hypothetical protein
MFEVTAYEAAVPVSSAAMRPLARRTTRMAGVALLSGFQNVWIWRQLRPPARLGRQDRSAALAQNARCSAPRSGSRACMTGNWQRRASWLIGLPWSSRSENVHDDFRLRFLAKKIIKIRAIGGVSTTC